MASRALGLPLVAAARSIITVGRPPITVKKVASLVMDLVRSSLQFAREGL
jgi:hypothetical protein